MIKDQYMSGMPTEEICSKCGEKMWRLRSPEGKEWLYCYCAHPVGDSQTNSRECTTPFSEKTGQ
jgi:hypothetical protein